MNPQVASVLLRAIAEAAAETELVLRVGADVVVRVVEAPPDGGRGVISLAGQLLEAQLPAELAPGQTLPVRVAEAGPEQIVLRVRDDGQPPTSTPSAHATGALAVSGDPQLVRVATALVPLGLALPLPNGDALQLAVRDESEEAGGEEAGDGRAEAAFVLHSAELGPIEVRLQLGAGVLAVGVSVEERALAEAQAALPELVSGLQRATGTPARVGLATRPADGPAPRPPRVAEGLDAYA